MTDPSGRAGTSTASDTGENTGDAHDQMALALARAGEGRMDEAEALLGRALALEPRNPAILVGLAVLRVQQGRLRDAVLACDAAIRIAPAYADAWRQRGAVLAAGGSMANARLSFSEAVRLAPRDAAAQAGLAALAAREGAFDEAREHAERALAADPCNVVAACSLGRAMLAGGMAAEVPPLLSPHLGRLEGPSSDRVLALNLLADAAHRLGNHEEAYAHYAASKADFADLNALEGERLTHTQFIEAIHEGLRVTDTSAWPAASARQPATAIDPHVFLIGYPRSGTTLVENVLASLDGVAALEERPTLVDADLAYLGGDRAGIVEALARFGQAPEDELRALREAYWRKVHSAGIAASASAFVDMDPLKGTRLPLIARLFPESRIIIMRRDPRDIVWSCFKTNFAMTSGTLEYTTLEGAARHYDALMRLTELALEKLKLATHVVHYHELVQHFGSTTRQICDFAGIEWSDCVHRFDTTAQRRGVSTASAAQVRRGLYDGTGQWKPYARWLEPVMPILSPWIEKFGYTL